VQDASASFVQQWADHARGSPMGAAIEALMRGVRDFNAADISTRTSARCAHFATKASFAAQLVANCSTLAMQKDDQIDVRRWDNENRSPSGMVRSTHSPVRDHT